MKKLLVLFLTLFLGTPVFAASESTLLKTVSTQIQPLNVINWKVGEFTEYTLDSSFGSLGTMHKKATAEQGNAIWVKTEISGMMSQNSEILLDRADGHIIEYRENGQPKPVPDQKVEIISQEATTVTVPAGTFEVIHIVAKADGKDLQLWANPRDIPLDGAAQMTIDTGMIPITIKLTKFGGK